MENKNKITAKVYDEGTTFNVALYQELSKKLIPKLKVINGKAQVMGKSYFGKLPKTKSYNYKYLTRNEMWVAIVSKYPSLKVININAPFKLWNRHITRHELLMMIFDIKIHRSRHLTKKQKDKIKQEMEDIKMNRIVEEL